MLVEVQIDEEPVCAEPPLGATAPLEGTTVANITLEKGYFRTSNKSHDILQCYQKHACLGGNDTDDYCAPGYNGPCEKTLICGCSRCNVCWVGPTACRGTSGDLHYSGY